MNTVPRHFKFSGMVPPHDQLHQVFDADGAPETEGPDEHYIGPSMIRVNVVEPTTKTIFVAQYSPTVVGTDVDYAPATNCGGNFMSANFQPNNNCYNYGCNIATNSFAQPGRKSGYLITEVVGDTIESYAEKDGLIAAKDSSGNPITSASDLYKFAMPDGVTAGHFVALMISDPGDANWPGDYHWARCNSAYSASASATSYSSWSQKDGNDQVTDFDFAGAPITDPATANWTVNQGPVNPPQPPLHMNSSSSDLVATYVFHSFMFVPTAGKTVSIL